MKKIRVEYYKNKCIGNGSCAAIAPDYYKLVENKAVLKNSNNTDKDVYVIERNCNKNTAKSLIEAGRACPVNAIRVIDLETNKDIVNINIREDGVKEVKAGYDDSKEFVLDSAGYFLIRLDRNNGNIEVAFCNEKNKIILKVTGKNPTEIYKTILNKEKLGITRDHAAYLGKELQKAYLALKYNLKYVQDKELDLNNKLK